MITNSYYTQNFENDVLENVVNLKWNHIILLNRVLCEVIHRRRNDPSWAVVVVCKYEEDDNDEQRVTHFEQDIVGFTKSYFLL